MHNSDPENSIVAAARPEPGPLNARMARPEPRYVGSEVFRRPAFGSNHPLKIMRHSTVLDLVRILGWLPQDSFSVSEPASIDQLLAFHDRDYLEALQYADSEGMVEPAVRQRHHIGTMANPVFSGLFERACTAVGGSILAAELACDGHVAFHPSGGTHHGRPGRASGFCYLNDPVFAILTLLDRGRERVLYVDLDAHHGDGVENAFADEPRVATVSIHEEKRWPYTGGVGRSKGVSVYNFPVPQGVNDSELEYLMQHAVLPLAAEFAPQAVVLCCGADSLAGDPLSRMMLSNVALWQAIDQLIEFGQSTVILGGGGYNPWTVARYWAGIWGRINHFDMPERLPGEAVDLMRKLECELVDEEDIDVAWLTTMADSPYPGPVRDAVKSLAETVRNSSDGVA